MKALEHAHHGLGVKGEQLSVAHGDRLASQLPAQVSEPIQKRTARVPRPARGPAIVTPPPVAKVPLPPCRMPMSLVVGEEEEPLPSNGQLGDSGHDWLHPASATSPIVIHDDGDGEEVVVAEDLNSTSSTSMLSHEMMSSSTAMLPGEMMSSSSSSSLPACQRGWLGQRVEGVGPEEEGVGPEEEGVGPEGGGLGSDEEGVGPEGGGVGSDEEGVGPEGGGGWLLTLVISPYMCSLSCHVVWSFSCS